MEKHALPNMGHACMLQAVYVMSLAPAVCECIGHVAFEATLKWGQWDLFSQI